MDPSQHPTSPFVKAISTNKQFTMSRTEDQKTSLDLKEQNISSAFPSTLQNIKASIIQPKKKRKLDDALPISTSDLDQAKIESTKKQHIQRTNKNHIMLQNKCDLRKRIPMSNCHNDITIKPSTNSLMQLKTRRPQLSNTLPYMDKPGRNWQSRHYVTPQVWWPYTDDIFLIWPHRREELDSFIVRLSQVNDTIKFIPETSLKMTNFLDVTENMNETTSTSLFGKPTNIQLKFRPPEFKRDFQ